MANSDVEIVTQALACLGEPGISAMDEESDTAETASALYEDLIQNLIASHPWRFCMVKKQLSRLSASPANEWTYQFTLPPDRVGDPYAVFNSSAVGARPIQNFEVFAGVLMTDEPSIWIDYRQRTAETNWPPYFVILARWALASELAEPVTEDSSKAEYWRVKAFGTPAEQGQGGQIRHCRQLNAFQQPPEPLRNFPLLDARFAD